MKQIIKDPGLIAPGLYINGSQITIDTDLWTTQALLTKKLGCGRNVVNNRVLRGIAAGTLLTYYISALGVRLIPNVNSINDL